MYEGYDARDEEKNPEPCPPACVCACVFAVSQEEDRLSHEDNQKLMLEAHRRAWEADLAEKQRLSVMLPQKVAFQVRAPRRPACLCIQGRG